MISFFKKIKFNNSKVGMTYVELIVVLSIFGTMTAIVMGNYGTFQEKVDIKQWANDIALKIVEAQKSAMNGKIPNKDLSFYDNWTPSYGIYFNLTNSQITNNKTFYYFADSDNGNSFNLDFGNCSDWVECLDKITMTKNFISQLRVYNSIGLYDSPFVLNITFTRPNSGAIFVYASPTIIPDYAQITISSPNNVTANIKVYASGRIQIN